MIAYNTSISQNVRLLVSKKGPKCLEHFYFFAFLYAIFSACPLASIICTVKLDASAINKMSVPLPRCEIVFRTVNFRKLMHITVRKLQN